MDVQPSPACKDKEILAADLTQARSLYAAATRTLDGLSSGAFDQAYERAENARAAYEFAARALRNHTKEHGC
jgi:hypothetical protein